MSTGTRCPIAPTGNLRPAIAKLAQLFSLLKPAIVNHSPVIVKLAQLFSMLSPAIANVAQQIAKLAQLLSSFTLRSPSSLTWPTIVFNQI